MTRKLLIFCITIVIASTNVSPMRVQRATRSPFLSNVKNASTYSLPDIQGEDLIYGDRFRRSTNDRKTRGLKYDENIPMIPKSCESSTICEEALNYPEAAVERLIKSLGKDKISIELEQIDDLDNIEIIQRTNVNDKGDALCKANEKVVYPRAGVDKNNKWHFLLNTANTKIQGLRVQTCAESGCNCNSVIAAFDDGYRGRCTQYFFYRTATAVRKNGKNPKAETYTVQIKLPNNCACVAQK